MTDVNSTHLKRCRVCLCEKSISLFYPNRRSKDGFQNLCKECDKKKSAAARASRTPEKRAKDREYTKAYREANRERIGELNRTWQRTNRARVEQYRRDYYSENRGAILEDRKKYYAANADLRVSRQREYLMANADAVRARAKEAHGRRYKTDALYTLRLRIGNAVRESLKGRVKSSRTFAALGYSVDDLKSHLASKFSEGMSMEKLLDGSIHIDHIRPISSFTFKGTDDLEFKKCWALENLQPLWAKDNLSKGAKYDPS